jgi:hypothetical protein
MPWGWGGEGQSWDLVARSARQLRPAAKLSACDAGGAATSPAEHSAECSAAQSLDDLAVAMSAWWRVVKRRAADATADGLAKSCMPSV